MPRRNVSRACFNRRLDAEDAGKRAALDGLPVSANPYRAGSDAAASWKRGYRRVIVQPEPQQEAASYA